MRRWIFLLFLGLSMFVPPLAAPRLVPERASVPSDDVLTVPDGNQDEGGGDGSGGGGG